MSRKKTDPEKIFLPDNEEDMRAALESMDPKELMELAESVFALESRLMLAGPETDEELHEWLKSELGVTVPRVSVCSDHQAPFDFISDAYFHRHSAFLVMANRGGSKTFGVACLHVANAHFKPKVSSATVGAIEAQARRAYAHVQTLLNGNPKLQAEVINTILSETKWKNGARLEVLGGTMAAVNGPHPQIVHFDEVELADPDVFFESRNMSMSANGIPAQDIITSTRKRGVGMMQTLIDEINDAKAEGYKPPYEMYTWCFKETAQAQPHCRQAFPDLPEDEKCECDQVVKGRWDDGSPRRFSDVCKGDLSRSDGWVPLSDLHKTFLADSQDVWEAQIECAKPSTEGLILARFNSDRQSIRAFTPNPDDGPIFAGMDFGGTNPHCVLWIQFTEREVMATNMQNKPVRIPHGSIVVFDEFYKAEIGNQKLADEIVAREDEWSVKVPGFRVVTRYADPQGKAARLDLKQHVPSVVTSAPITRDVEEHIKELVNLIDEDRLWVSGDRCRMTVEEANAWHRPKKKGGLIDQSEKPVMDFDHAMSALRYGAYSILRKHGRTRGSKALPRASERDETSPVRPYRRPPTTNRRYHGTNGVVPWRRAIRP